MKTPAALWTGLLLVCCPGVSEAQGPCSVQFATVDTPAEATMDLRLSDARPPNYGLVGGLAGGTVGVVLGALAGSAMKHSEVQAGDAAIVVVGVAGGLIGTLVGYGFGREIERHPTETAGEGANAP